ncbi:unnamed protein product [Phytophthora fragariaefolia]|uniref:Elongator complex protein 1 n=1 Tax=Phytophthora fragariaefolia TaxID=1490495 RepID=A0A9W6Y4A0_9STRA|nr:unnamed protein product [Phytophthora fragariaefolia]
MSFVAELGALVCASRSGAIVAVDVEAAHGEEVGAVAGGLRAVAWSDSHETLALVTGAGSLLVMSSDWEVLHETQLQTALAPELELGGCERDAERWCCQLRWREDAKFVALNVAAVDTRTREPEHKVLVFTEQLELHARGRLEDGRAIPGLGPALDWSQSLGLIASCEVRKGRLLVVFFERNGLRHGEFAIPAAYRAPEFRVANVRWNATSDTLALSLHRTAGSGEEGGERPQAVVQLWSRNNYHWYLKQEMQLPNGDELVDFAWDEEAAGRLRLLTCSSRTQELTFCEREFAWDICSVEAEWVQVTQPTQKPQHQSIAVAGVIDGAKLLLTPLHRALVPPPFALLQVTFDAAVNSVAFDSQGEALIVLLANGSVVLVENYLNPADTRTSAAGLPPSPSAQNVSSDASMLMTEVSLPQPAESDDSFTLQDILWVRFVTVSRRLIFAGKTDRQDQIVLCSLDNINAVEENGDCVIVHQTDLDNVGRVCDVQHGDDREILDATRIMLALQTHDGTVYTLNVASDATVVPTRVSGKLPVFSHLTVLSCRSGKLKSDQVDDGVLVIGLESSSAKLYVNGELLASACSSFRYSVLPSVLLFTTQGRKSQLRMTPLNDLRRNSQHRISSGANTDTITFESRSIERGALLVATVGQRASVIVQMPRGNLECTSPRLLVLALAVQHIEKQEYVAALELCRRHRLDLNVLVDYNPQAFIKSLSRFFIQDFLSTKLDIVTSDRLCLFITNLHSVDVWTTKYGPLLEPFNATCNDSEVREASGAAYGSEGKINVVCQGFMNAIQEVNGGVEGNEAALLLPFVTSAVKQSPPRFDDALSKIQKLLCRNEQSSIESDDSRNRAAATRAIKHLIMLTDVDSLYSEALGLYDLDLVRAIATHSQRDPKEYVPFLDRVAHLNNENMRKYTIDTHLKRHARALTHLAALIEDTSVNNQEEQSKLKAMALKLIEEGELYDQALKLFPLSSAKYSMSQSRRAFCLQIMKQKGDFLEAEKKYEAAAYVYLSASEKEKARRAFIAANKWQISLALSARDQTPDQLRSEAYTIAQELLNRQQQDGSIDDILAVVRIYVEYCNDVDEAVALLVTHQQWAEALRIAYLHKRDDLVESDIETGVLQCSDDVLEELERKEKQYVKCWTRLTTIREQKRLFKLHGINGSRWDQCTRGDGNTDADSIRSGASSAADSALSNISMSSVGSHNSAASIGNFSMQTLSMATASHFYATQALGDAGKKPKTKDKHGGIPSRRERRKRMKEGSAEEEAYVAQQLSELRPNSALAKEIGALLEMLVFFGHIQQAQNLQTQFAKFEQCVADMKIPPPTETLSNSAKLSDEDNDYPQWRLAALQG